MVAALWTLALREHCTSESGETEKVKRSDWQPAARASQQYEHDLLAILKSIFGDSPALEGLPARILSTSEFLEKYALQAALRMISGRYVANARTWRAAARESMRGDVIYRALQNELAGPVGIRVRELIQENARLIRTLPQSVAEKATAMIATQAQAGERAEINIPALMRHVSRSQARVIARTETSKASTALTQARSEELGIGWFLWWTSHDERVRRSHRNMDGVLCRWNDPPSPEKLIGEKSTLGRYLPGNAPNCRCGPSPLLRYSQVSWPHRSYIGGRIQPMTLATFRKLSDTNLPLAA